MSTNNINYPIRTGRHFRAFIEEQKIGDSSLSSFLQLKEERIARIRAGKVWTKSIPYKYHKAIDDLVRKHRFPSSTKPAVSVAPTETTGPVEPNLPGPPESTPDTHLSPEAASGPAPAQSAPQEPSDNTREAEKSSQPDPKVRPDAACQPERVGDTPITFGVVTKHAGSLSKQIYLNETGELVKDSTCCWLAEGAIQSYRVPLSKLAEGLSRLESNQALVLTNRQLDPNTRIVSNKNRQDGTITRTRKDLQYVDGEPALLLLDADPSACYTAASVDAFLKDCASFMPGLDGCAYVATHSTSSCVSKEDGTPLTGVGGFHVYVVVKDAGRLRDPVVLKQLKDRVLARAWLADKGELFIDQAGRAHRRCILDVSVWQPERQSFEGPPSLAEGLVQNRPPAEYRDGIYLDLEALLEPLTWAEQQQYVKLVEDEARLLDNEIQSRRQAYIDTEVKKLTDKGLSDTEAKDSVRARVDDGVIKGNQTLHLHQSNRDIAAWEVLANIDQHDGAYLADPLEPDYGAAPGGICRTKAQIHDDGPRGINIWSFAHGGRLFRIEHTEETLRKHLELLAQNQPEQFKQTWPAISASVPMSSPQRDTLCHWLKTLDPMRGARVASVREELTAALELKEERCLPKHDAPDLGDAERDPADIRREYAEQCQHLIDDPDPLGTLVRRVQEMGVVGEEVIIRAIYLAANSPLLGIKHNIHVIVRGQSSTGKSHVVTTTLTALPEDCVEEIISGSEKSLHHSSPDEYVGKVLYLDEANRLIDPHSELVVALRTLLTKGKMVYQTVEKDPETGNFHRVKKQLNGPMSFITTSTMQWIDEEMETRLLSLDTDERPEQTRSIMIRMADQQGHPSQAPDKRMADFHAYYKWIAYGPRIVVLGGWIKPLAETLPDNIVRIRRDYRRLESLAMVSALINQPRRPRNSQGYIIATLEDYGVAREIIAPPLKRVVGANLPEETNNFVTYIYGKIKKVHGTGTAVGALLKPCLSTIDDSTSVIVSTRELANALDISQATVRRRIATLIDLGVLHRFDNGKKGRPMQLALGDLDILCNDAGDGVIPTAEELAAMMKEQGIDELAGTEL